MATRAQASGIEFKLEGLDEIMYAFDRLPSTSMKKANMRKAMKAALRPTQAAAQAAAPKGPRGNLQKSIVVTSLLKKSQRVGGQDRSAIHMYVGSTAPHAHLVEFGTAERELKKDAVVKIKGTGQIISRKAGDSTGRVRPNPFLRNAWDATKGATFEIFRQHIGANVAKAIKMLRKKKAKGTLSAQQKAGWSSFLDTWGAD